MTAAPAVLAPLVLGFVTLERLLELAWARRNTRRLLAMGATEAGAGHYPLIVALHAAWLAGLWALAWDRPVALPWLAVFALLQFGRAWVLATLGGRWTTRIIVLPGAPLVRKGPYRVLAHPNYAVVAGEILVLPLVVHLPLYALAFTLLNAAVLAVRVRAEDHALERAPGLSSRKAAPAACPGSPQAPAIRPDPGSAPCGQGSGRDDKVD